MTTRIVQLFRGHYTSETVAVLNGAFGKLYEEQAPSTLLGTIFNAFEFDFLEVVEQRLPDLRDVVTDVDRNVVLQLAVCDRESPAAWAVPFALSHFVWPTST